MLSVMNSTLFDQSESAFRRGYALHTQSRFIEAQALYRQTVQWNPQHFNAWHLLGLICLQTHRAQEALDLIGRAISLAPQVAGFHLNRANALCSLNRLPEAIAGYDRAIELAPDFADAYCNRGHARLAMNRIGSALEDFDRVIELIPGHADAHNSRGLALERLGRLEQALESFERAIAASSDHAASHCNRANVLMKLGRLDEALASYDQAIAHQPDLVDAYSNRSCVLREMKRFDEAIKSCDEAISIRPNHPAGFLNRGLILEERGAWIEALADYQKALVLKPDFSTAHFNRANVLCKLHDVQGALASYDAALALDANFQQARWGRSMAYLLAGDFERGFRDYENRQTSTAAAARRHFSKPLWLGQESLSDKTILLHSEGGFGDVIQFCRYATLVAGLAGRVVLEAPRPLISLLRGLKGVAQLIPQGEPLPPFDCQCSLMSLPFACATTLASIPAGTPYLRADDERLRQWRDRCGPRSRPRVGLVWSGGRESRMHRSAYLPDKLRRNIPLSKLNVLANPDIEFFSLQIGQSAESELAQMIAADWGGPDLIDLTQQIQDFEDTAALIAQLDLVISVDTSTAHLAGALGKPVWILIRFDACWRWMLDRIDCPWYPTARLYRQERPGEWDAVIARVRDDLAARTS
jgi:tetratricopeptide (TPR) repeat protein